MHATPRYATQHSQSRGEQKATRRANEIRGEALREMAVR